jgi:tetratricopeptide (TPR) repeat protein
VLANDEADGGEPSLVRYATLARLDLELRAEQARGLAIVDSAMARVEQMTVLDRPYLRFARILATAGRPQRARSLIEAFESEVLPSMGISSTAELLRTRAAIALAEDRFDDAIAGYLQADEGRCLGRCYGLARAYDLAGQPDSAIAVYHRYATVHDVHGWWLEDRFQLAPTFERLGQLYDAVEDWESSATYYAKFIDLWIGADEVLQPRVERARARLAEILAERG